MSLPLRAGANESLVLPPPPKLNEEVVLVLLAADAGGFGPLTVSGLLSAPASDDGELVDAKAGVTEEQIRFSNLSEL